MERRENLFEKFSTAQNEVASLLEGIMNERNDIKMMNDKLSLNLKKSLSKIQTLRKQIQLYKVAHSKLKNIFLSGLEVFKLVDFSNYASIELNKFSLEVLQKHFLDYADQVGSLCEIPTERELKCCKLRRQSRFLENREKRRRVSSNIVSSDSEVGSGGDETDLELAAISSLEDLDSRTDDEQLLDSGLESVKEELGTNEIDLSDINFGEDFSTNPKSVETPNDANENDRPVTVVSHLRSWASNVKQSNAARVKPKVLTEIRNEKAVGNQKLQERIASDSIINETLPENSVLMSEMSHQVNDPARGMLNNCRTLTTTPRSVTPITQIIPQSAELFDSSASEQIFLNPLHEGISIGDESVRIMRPETHTSQLRCNNTPVTVQEDDVLTNMINRVTRSPVFKDCNPRKHAGRREDYAKDCQTPFRQLNNFRVPSGRSFMCRSAAKKKLFSRKNSTNFIQKRPRQGEDGYSGMRRLRQTFLNTEHFKRRKPEEGTSFEDRENKGSFSRNQQLDCSGYNNKSDDDDDDDDIIFGSPEKDSQLYFNPGKQNTDRDLCHQTVSRTLVSPDLDETFISPTVVKNYQKSLGMGLPTKHTVSTRETSPEYDSVPFVYHRGPVRKKAERMKLPGQACPECNKYYNNVYGDSNTCDYNRMLNKCSRHRNAGGQEDTPPGFWTPFLTGNEEG